MHQPNVEQAFGPSLLKTIVAMGVQTVGKGTRCVAIITVDNGFGDSSSKPERGCLLKAY